MNQPLQPADRGQLQESLTAYLDGELDADAARSIEELVAVNDEARAELHRLEKAWDMLDCLDRAQVDEDFTHTTIKMVAVRAEEEVRSVVQAPPAMRWKRALAGVAAVAAACFAGFFMANRVWPDENERLLRDLPVLENLDHYSQVDSVEFLKLLREKELFAGEPKDHE